MSTTIFSTRLLPVGALLAGVLCPATAFAELLAYEGFDYTSASETPPNLTNGTLNGGIGWENAWIRSNPTSGSTAATVQPESLSYTDAGGYSLLTSGGHAFLSGVPREQAAAANGYDTQVRRNLANPLLPQPGRTLYLSFLGQRIGEPSDLSDPIWADTSVHPNGYPWGDNLYPRNAALALHDTASGTSSNAILGNLSNQSTNLWTFVSESTHILTDNTFTDPAMVVLRLDYTPELEANMRGELVASVGTIATLWINPTSLLTENRAEAQRVIVLEDLVDPYDIIVRAIGLEVGNDSYYRKIAQLLADEIRLGTTWDAVTPVEGGKPTPVEPEPRFFGGLEITTDNHVYAGAHLGWLWVEYAPWAYSHKLKTWLYLDDEALAAGPLWIYALDLAD